MWTVSVLWERPGGTIKEKVEDCECGKGDCRLRELVGLC